MYAHLLFATAIFTGINYMNRYSFIFRIIITGLAALCLTACGPIYDTKYSYVPPKDTTGIMCVTSCGMTRSNCQQMEFMNKERCEERHEDDYRWCLKHNDKKDDCYRTSCSSNTEHCTEEYNTCYQSCGGTINSQQVCTAFCQ